MNIVSITDEAGEEYKFEQTVDDVTLLKVIRRSSKEYTRIIGYYVSYNRGVRTFTIDGNGNWCTGSSDKVILKPYLEQTEMTVKEIESKLGIRNLKIIGE